MKSCINFEGVDYPRVKVSGKKSLPDTLTLQDKILITGELCYCATQHPSTVGQGLYYNVEVLINPETAVLLQSLSLDSGQRLNPEILDNEKLSILIKKRGITYNKPARRITVYWRGETEPLYMDRELKVGCLARVAATISLDKNKETFSITLGVIQILSHPMFEDD